MTRPDQASAPEQGVALTEGERERLARAHVHISPADLYAAVEQIIRDRTPGIQAAAWDEGAAANAENAAREVWQDGEPLTNPYRDSATGGGA